MSKRQRRESVEATKKIEKESDVEEIKPVVKKLIDSIDPPFSH